MSDLIERLRDGCVLHPKRWIIDEAATDTLMAEAADALEAAQKDVMRAYDLEANWSRCSRACAGEQTKRKQAEAHADRLTEALRSISDLDEREGDSLRNARSIARAALHHTATQETDHE